MEGKLDEQLQGSFQRTKERGIAPSLSLIILSYQGTVTREFHTGNSRQEDQQGAQ